MIETFSDKDKLVVRYLFNELDENKAREVEDEILLDEEFAERAEVVEMNLIDCYVRNELTAAECLRFQERFLVDPENKIKVDRARMFQESLRLGSDENQFVTPTHNQRWRDMFPGFFARPLPALVLVATVMILIAALIMFEILRRTPEPNNLTTNSAPPAPVNQNAVAPEPVKPEPQSKTAGPELARNDSEKYQYIHRQDRNGSERGGTVVHLAIGPQVKTLNLVYELGNDKAAARETYGITIKNQYGERVWPQNKIREEIKPVFEKSGKRQKLIVVKVPLKVFTDDGPYSFEIDDQYLPAKQFTVKK